LNVGVRSSIWWTDKGWTDNGWTDKGEFWGSCGTK